jgi:hypothetical protein
MFLSEAAAHLTCWHNAGDDTGGRHKQERRLIYMICECATALFAGCRPWGKQVSSFSTLAHTIVPILLMLQVIIIKSCGGQKAALLVCIVCNVHQSLSPDIR